MEVVRTHHSRQSDLSRLHGKTDTAHCVDKGCEQCRCEAGCLPFSSQHCYRHLWITRQRTLHSGPFHRPTTLYGALCAMTTCVRLPLSNLQSNHKERDAGEERHSSIRRPGSNVTCATNGCMDLCLFNARAEAVIPISFCVPSVSSQGHA